MCNRLDLVIIPIDINVTGINQRISRVSYKVQVNIKSRVSNYEFTMVCLVIPKIKNNLPSQSCHLTSLQIPSN